FPHAEVIPSHPKAGQPVSLRYRIEASSTTDDLAIHVPAKSVSRTPRWSDPDSASAVLDCILTTFDFAPAYRCGDASTVGRAHDNLDGHILIDLVPANDTVGRLALQVHFTAHGFDTVVDEPYIFVVGEILIGEDTDVRGEAAWREPQAFALTISTTAGASRGGETVSFSSEFLDEVSWNYTDTYKAKPCAKHADGGWFTCSIRTLSFGDVIEGNADEADEDKKFWAHPDRPSNGNARLPHTLLSAKPAVYLFVFRAKETVAGRFDIEIRVHADGFAEAIHREDAWQYGVLYPSMPQYTVLEPFGTHPAPYEVTPAFPQRADLPFDVHYRITATAETQGGEGILVPVDKTNGWAVWSFVPVESRDESFATFDCGVHNTSEEFLWCDVGARLRYGWDVSRPDCPTDVFLRFQANPDAIEYLDAKLFFTAYGFSLAEHVPEIKVLGFVNPVASVPISVHGEVVAGQLATVQFWINSSTDSIQGETASIHRSQIHASNGLRWYPTTDIGSSSAKVCVISLSHYVCDLGLIGFHFRRNLTQTLFFYFIPDSSAGWFEPEVFFTAQNFTEESASPAIPIVSPMEVNPWSRVNSSYPPIPYGHRIKLHYELKPFVSATVVASFPSSLFDTNQDHPYPTVSLQDYEDGNATLCTLSTAATFMDCSVYISSSNQWSDVFFYMTPTVGAHSVTVTFASPNFFSVVDSFNVTVLRVPTWTYTPQSPTAYEHIVLTFTGDLFPLGIGLSTRKGEDIVKVIKDNQNCEDEAAQVHSGSWEVTDLLPEAPSSTGWKDERVTVAYAHFTVEVPAAYRVCYKLRDTELFLSAFHAKTGSDLLIVDTTNPSGYSTSPYDAVLQDVPTGIPIILNFLGHDLHPENQDSHADVAILPGNPDETGFDQFKIVEWQEIRQPRFASALEFAHSLCHGTPGVNSSFDSYTVAKDTVVNGSASHTYAVKTFDYPGSFAVCYRRNTGRWLTFPDKLRVVPHAPVIMGISGCVDFDRLTFDCQSNGSQPLIIWGQFFGEGSSHPLRRASVRVGDRWCETVHHRSDSEVECSGYAQQRDSIGKVVVSVVSYHGLASNQNEMFITLRAVPRISAVTGCLDNVYRNDTIECRRSGGQTVTIHGEFLGLPGQSLDVYFGGDRESLEESAVHCKDARRISSNHVECREYRGEGYELVVRVVVNEEISGGRNLHANGVYNEEFTMSFERFPIVTSVEGCADSVFDFMSTFHCPRAGYVPLTVHGRYFAPPLYPGTTLPPHVGATVSVGNLACNRTWHVAGRESNALVCVEYPGSGFDMNVSVETHNGYSSMDREALLSYAQECAGQLSDTVYCTAHGDCDFDTGVCICRANAIDGYWNGTACDDCAFGYFGPKCLNSCKGGSCNPCSGRGECDMGLFGSGNCTCYKDAVNGWWTGDICSGCEDGYFGKDCESRCPGVNSTCSGHGACSGGRFGQGTCTCDAGWGPGFFAGDDCDECLDGVWGLDCRKPCPGGIASPCGGFAGKCDSGRRGNGTCTCQPGHYGPACASECPGGSRNPCNGRGMCFYDTISDRALCVCDNGYAGAACDKSCEGAPLGPLCSGHGSCDGGSAGSGQCVCDGNFGPATLFDEATLTVYRNPLPVVCDRCNAGYFGGNCDIACPGGLNNSCSLHGQCNTTTGDCECTDRFAGFDCSIPCDGLGGQAELSGYNLDFQWHVRNCTSMQCPADDAGASSNTSGILVGVWGNFCEKDCRGGRDAPCTGHGVCSYGRSGTGECQCSAGWSGWACEIACPGEAENPCHSLEWQGVCPGGVLGSNGTCVCSEGFAGFDCGTVCPGPRGNPCTGHGTCDDGADGTGLCDCHAGFAGWACDIACPGIANNSVVCSGNGICRDGRHGDGTCECDGNFNGTDCEVCIALRAGPQCDIPCLPLDNPCNGAGVCRDGIEGDGNCDCDHGYAGDYCEFSCPVSPNGLVCNGVGTCNATALGCECGANSYGEDCSVYCDAEETCRDLLDPALLLSDPDNVYPTDWKPVSCNATGSCTCYQDGGQRGYWDGPFCSSCMYGYKGFLCNRECECSGHGACERYSGKCICDAEVTRGYWDGSTCNVCLEGWIGLICAEPNVDLSRVGNLEAGSIGKRQKSAGTGITLFDSSSQWVWGGSWPITRFRNQNPTIAPEEQELDLGGAATSAFFAGNWVILAVRVYYAPGTPGGVCSVGGTALPATSPRSLSRISCTTAPTPDEILNGGLSWAPGEVQRDRIVRVHRDTFTLHPDYLYMSCNSCVTNIFNYDVANDVGYWYLNPGLTPEDKSIEVATVSISGLTPRASVALPGATGKITAIQLTDPTTVDVQATALDGSPLIFSVERYALLSDSAAVLGSSAMVTHREGQALLSAPEVHGTTKMKTHRIVQPLVFTHWVLESIAICRQVLCTIGAHISAGGYSYYGIEHAVTTDNSRVTIAKADTATRTVIFNSIPHAEVGVEHIIVDGASSLGFVAINNRADATAAPSSPGVIFKWSSQSLAVRGRIVLNNVGSNVETVLGFSINGIERTLYVSIALPSLRIMQITLYSIIELQPPYADLRGGTPILVVGEGFTASADGTLCKFGSDVYPGTFVDSTSIRCLSPPAETSSGCAGMVLEVSIALNRFTDNKRSLGYANTPIVTSVTPAQGNYNQQPTVTVTGFGFQDSKQFLKCRFGPTESSAPAASHTYYSLATFIDSRIIHCKQPIRNGPSPLQSTLDVSVDGKYFSSSNIEYATLGSVSEFSAAFVSAGVRVASEIVQAALISSIPNVNGRRLDEVGHFVSSDKGFAGATVSVILRLMTVPQQDVTHMLKGNTTVWAQGGEATFSGLSLAKPKAGEYTLSVTHSLQGFADIGQTLAVLALTITAGDPHELKWMPSALPLPSRTTAEGRLPQVLSIQLVDVADNPIFVESLQIAAAAAPVVALSGNIRDFSPNTVVATFDDLYIPGRHTINYTVTFFITALAKTIEPLDFWLLVSDCPADGMGYPQYAIANETFDTCYTCPTGAACFGNVSVYAQQGFWRRDVEGYRYLFHSCPQEEACLGGQNSTCAEGYKGTVCGLCKSGFGRSRKTCLACDEWVKSFLLFCLYLVVVIVIFGCLVRAALEDNALFSKLGADRRYIAPVLKLLLNALQMLTLTVEFDLKWPQVLGDTFDIAEAVSSIDLNTRAFSCAFTDTFLTQYVIYMLIPAFILACSLLVWGTQIAWRSLRRIPIGPKLERLVTFNVVAFFIVFPTLLKNTAFVFNCVDYSGETVLVRDPNVECGTDAHQAYKKVAWVAAVLYGLVFPFAYLIIVGKYWYQGRFGERRLTNTLGFLFRGYKRDKWYWEVVVHIRKCLVVLIVIAFNDNPLLQTYVALWLIGFSLLMNLFFEPYVSKFIEQLENFSLAAAFTTINVGLMFTHVSDDAWVALLTAFLMVLNLSVLASFVSIFAKKLRDAAYARFDADGDGSVTWIEFVKGMKEYIIGAFNDDSATVRTARAKALARRSISAKTVAGDQAVVPHFAPSTHKTALLRTYDPAVENPRPQEVVPQLEVQEALHLPSPSVPQVINPFVGAKNPVKQFYGYAKYEIPENFSDSDTRSETTGDNSSEATAPPHGEGAMAAENSLVFSSTSYVGADEVPSSDRLNESAGGRLPVADVARCIGEAKEKLARLKGGVGLAIADFRDPTAKDDTATIVKVVRVKPHGPASKAGLRTNDRILSINDRPVYSKRSFLLIVSEGSPGDALLLEVKRGDDVEQVKLVVGCQITREHFTTLTRISDGLVHHSDLDALKTIVIRDFVHAW
ncbi:Cell death abnormality protein 1, partial [Diplonema papillatum]